MPSCSAADIQDRDGGVLLLATLFGLFPFLKKLFADSAYQGPIFHKAVGKILPQLDIEIVKRSDRRKGFAVLPKRWIVERTIALAQSMSPARQGLGKSECQSARFLALCLNPPHAQKTL